MQLSDEERKAGAQCIVAQYEIESESAPGRMYTISLDGNGDYSCSCLGWTRHVPRKDCKHIEWHKVHPGRPIDPMLAAMGKAQRRAVRVAQNGAQCIPVKGGVR
jgi:hypothetical protein